MHRTKWRESVSLRAAQALIMFFRAVFRIREATLPERKRTHLRRLRHKLEAMDKDRDIFLTRMKTEKGWEKFEALDEFMERHADPEMLERNRTHQEQMRTVRQESETLQAIRQQADGDLAAVVAAYQEYVKDHPESHWGYSYLGGALKQSGNLPGSLSAYREAVRLSAGHPVPLGSARISVANALSALGRPDAAMAELHDLIDTAASQHELTVCRAYDTLGDILMDQGDRKAACQAWQQAVKRDPTQIIGKKAREKIRANR